MSGHQPPARPASEDAVEHEAPAALHVVRHHAGDAGRGAPPGSGQRAAPTVVLVHGSLDRGSSFVRVVRRLPELDVVTYDRRGYHHSRAAGVARTLDDHVADLVSIVGEGPAVVIGHSYGGDVALGAALAAPDSIGAVGAYEPPLPWMDWWPRRVRSAAEEDPGVFAESFFRRLVGDAGWERLTDQARAARRADGPALVAELTDLRGGAAPFDPATLQVPAVLGRGELSLDHHRRAIEVLADLVPRAEVMDIPGAAHGVLLSHPDGFAALVRRVVRRAITTPATE
ncbi:MAG TPA: alpha/beta hydrolase [Acidimicrobiales bacterium]|nr:alpha/beta hydrolase [Acidimicrobiales bacterium]